MVAILVAVQFTHIIDFVVIMPLGPKLMRAFHIGTKEFGLLVSAYTLSAAVSSILASFFLDRFDRKKALIGLYIGFGISTLMCALSGGFWPLLTARVMAGAFGGILSALALSIIGDYIPQERRGRATGAIMSAFSLASVIGVPSGLWLAEFSDWHAPFFLLAVTTLPVIIAAWNILPDLNLHIQKGMVVSPWNRIVDVLKLPGARLAFFVMMVMMIAGFSVIPFISPYLVSNSGMPESKLSLIYLIGGVFTFLAAIISGRLSDQYGSFRIFSIFMPLSIIPILIITQLGAPGIPVILMTTSVFMALLSARLVPVVNMITSTVKPHQRGTFMSIVSSVQQFSSGAAAWIAGMIVTEMPNGKLVDFDKVGYMAASFSLISIIAAYYLRPFVLTSAPPVASSEPDPYPDTHQ